MKRKQTSEANKIIEQVIEELETHLSHKEHSTRTKQIRESVKRRNARFSDPKKLMLTLVINSIMRRTREQQEITSVLEKGTLRFDEEDVSKAVRDFYEEWMSSRVPVETRWESWEAMLDLDPSKLVHKEDAAFIREAYGETKDRYQKLQEEEGIWNKCEEECTTQELVEALKKMASGTAPGPSGLTYDILKAMTQTHLEPVRKVVSRVITTGQIEDDMNTGLLRPLPKSDNGLADLSQTRPIALMEALMKITERVMCDRIMKVVYANKMLREEQYGSLKGRSSKAPIRILTEIIEDALTTGKELHVFSADISKAFDSLEYWSQAMGWRALGMPKSLVNKLVQQDRGGSTKVILGQGRETLPFKSGRGVRQ